LQDWPLMGWELGEEEIGQKMKRFTQIELLTRSAYRDAVKTRGPAAPDDGPGFGV
jgi:hypothetical protein